MDIRQFDSWAGQLLGLEQFRKADNSLNGLQCGRYEAPLQRVAFAVDASLEAIERAAQRSAQLLVVHHGLFWAKSQALVGPLYQRVARLLTAELGLWACHLPLDAHPQLGNNAELARLLGLTELTPFGEYHGVMIGCKGSLAEAVDLDSLQARLLPLGARPLALLPFGPKLIRRVGIISGGAAFDVEQAIAQQLDLYITGEISHSVYHTVLEAGINMLSLGHYASEVHGVKALAEAASRALGLECFFIENPSGL